tara:strand:- start:240 stop:719 length:480 start_codon:yes stop_codon:yes gene_type:complete
MSSITGDKFKVNEKVWFSPPKADFVTIDVYEGVDCEGEFENSAEEWCVQLDGALEGYIMSIFETFCGFIKLISRRYASYHVDCYDFMLANGYDAVFVEGDEFYFCGNEVKNISITAYDLKNEEGVDFMLEDYGGDCCGWCDLFYIRNGKMFTLDKAKET